MSLTLSYFEALFGRAPEHEWIAITVVPEGFKFGDGPGPYWFQVSTLETAAQFAAERPSTSNVYVGVNTRKAKLPHGKRGGAEDVATISALCCDLDYEDDGHAPPGKNELPLPPNKAAVLALARESGLPPSMVIHTGGGLHAYWFLDEPIIVTNENRAAVKNFVKGWNDHLVRLGAKHGWHVDSVGSSIATVLRPAGTWRTKDRGSAKTPFQCEFVEFSGHRYSATQLVEAADTSYVPPVATATPPSTPAAPQQGQGGPRRLYVDSSEKMTPFGALDMLPWSSILLPFGWTFVGQGINEIGPHEKWLRPGDPASGSSMNCWPGYAVCHSTLAGLPAGAGQKLTKARVLCALANMSEKEAASEIRQRANRLKSVTP